VDEEKEFLMFRKICNDCDNSSVCLKARRCSHRERQLKRQEAPLFLPPFHWLGADAEAASKGK
jgi:hypothetical protein